jgi:hypothetical protein
MTRVVSDLIVHHVTAFATPFAAEAQPEAERSPTARFADQLHQRQDLHA